MTDERPLLSVVVLSYDRPAYLRQALASLVAQPVASRELLVVDNASPARNEVAAVVAEFPGTRLLRQETNLGFAGGMNAGLAEARGEYVLLTEDDLVLDPGCVSALLAHATRVGGRSILAGIMLDQGTTRIRCAGGELALGPPLALRILGAGEDQATARREPYGVTFLPGAFLLWPGEARALLGGFRRDYFLYFEDVELSLRARRAGVDLVVAPAARVSHLPPAVQAVPAWIEYHKIKNMVATYLLHAPLSKLPEVAVRYVLLEAVRRLRAGPAAFLAFARACGWLCLNGPRLLAERGKLRV